MPTPRLKFFFFLKKKKNPFLNLAKDYYVVKNKMLKRNSFNYFFTDIKIIVMALYVGRKEIEIYQEEEEEEADDSDFFLIKAIFF